MSSDDIENALEEIDRSTVETKLREREQGDIRTMFASITARHVTAVAWVVAAGCYGYIAGEWGTEAVNVSGASPYPEGAAVFMLFGVAVGVGFAGLIVTLTRGENGA